MIGRIMRKDWILLWPMVLLVTAIQVALQWTVYRVGLFGDSAAGLELLRPLTLAWFLGIGALTVAVVHQDPIPGVDQDWLIRPVRRAALAAAKLGFVLLAVCVPLLVLDVAQATAMGFAPAAAIPVLAAKEVYLFAFLLLPVLALASVTRNAAELALLGAALIVVYAGCTALGALFLGENRCPTCDSGFAWLNHLLQHLATGLGAALILTLQYRRRLSTVSRALALTGAAVLVCVQVPWGAAFALHVRLQGAPEAGAAIQLSRGVDAGDAAASATAAVAAAGAPAARQAAQALVHGDVDEAVELMRRRILHAAAGTAVLDVPVRVSGVAAREFLLVDRAEVTLLRAGRPAYRGTIPDESPLALQRAAAAMPDGNEFVVHQAVSLPASRGPAGSAPTAALRLEYFLTLMRQRAEYTLPAVDGRLRQAETGVCATRLDSESVTLRCKQLGRAPFCLSATLIAADGARNPPIVKCLPDYRPYGATFSALTFSGADLPVHDRYGLAHYPVDGAKAAGAHVLLQVYEVAAHLRRALTLERVLAPPPRAG